MRLRDFLRDDLVMFGLEAGTMVEVLDAIEGHLEAKGFVSSPSGVSAALRTREEAHTTVLGHGVAVPHATIASFEEMLLLVVSTATPVPFGPPDTEPVDLFFVLLSPRGREGSHIKLLARICRLARHPGVLEELRECSGREGLLETLLRVDSEHV